MSSASRIVGTTSTHSTKRCSTVPRVASACASRVDHDEGHALHGVVEQLLLAEPVVAQKVAVVGAEDDQRVVEPAAGGHGVEQAPQVVVELADQPLVHRAHGADAVVALETHALFLLPVRGQHRVRVAQLGVAAHHRQALIGRVHRVVRRRRHVGPVRLHVAQVQHPRLAAHVAHEGDRLVGHVRGLGVRLLNARRQVHVAHVPAAQTLAVRAVGRRSRSRSTDPRCRSRWARRYAG